MEKRWSLNKWYWWLTYKQTNLDTNIIWIKLIKLRSELISAHIKRLEEGKCSPLSNSIFINLVSNLERAGDHLSYIAHSLYDANI